MKILGKKYPKDAVAFEKSGLPGLLIYSFLSPKTSCSLVRANVCKFLRVGIFSVSGTQAEFTFL